MKTNFGFRDRTNSLTDLDEIDLHSRFRMNKRCFCNLLDRIELELRHATESQGGLLPIQTAGCGVAILCISIVSFVSGGMHIRLFLL